MQSFLASIAYELHIPYERYYQTAFYCIFHLLGAELSKEMKTNTGRIDVVAEDDCIYIF